MLYDDPRLVEDVFFEVGSRVKQYYEQCLAFDEVGAILCNDDWGFGAQTMVSPDTLRKCVFPWYREIVKAAHERGKPALLHSCGAYQAIIGDITTSCTSTAAFIQDKIVLVETAYAQLHERIAGRRGRGFFSRGERRRKYMPAANPIALSAKRAATLLAAANGAPDYIPNENLSPCCLANEEVLSNICSCASAVKAHKRSASCSSREAITRSRSSRSKKLYYEKENAAVSRWNCFLFLFGIPNSSVFCVRNSDEGLLPPRGLAATGAFIKGNASAVCRKSLRHSDDVLRHLEHAIPSMDAFSYRLFPKHPVPISVRR